MGLMDKLKGAVKAVTGGAAKVTIEMNQPLAMPGESVGVRVTVTSTGGEVKSKGVFIDVHADERVSVNKKASELLDQNLVLSRETFSQAFQIAGELVLGAGETQTFEGQVVIPPNVQPSFSGTFTEHQWQIRGRLEARGNDPDSGFSPIRVGLRG